MARRAPTHVVAHLSDLHLRPASDPLVDGVVDARARLVRAVEVLTGWDVECDAWLFTGDLSDTGTPDTYSALVEVVEPAARERGVRVIWGNGNHDDRGTLARVLLGSADGFVNRAYDVGGLRVLTLDTCVPGDSGGEIAAASLEWLRGELGRPAEHGTILALHHPPLPAVQDAATLWDLRNPDALASVIAGSDVRLIVGGHFHQTSFTTLAGVPVAVAPSLVYTQDLTRGRTLRGQNAHAGFNLIEVYPEQVVVTSVALDAGASVHATLTPADVERMRADG